MKIQTERSGEMIDSNYLLVTIGDRKYKISEEHGKLIINKHCFDGDDSISINPQYGNQIAIN